MSLFRYLSVTLSFIVGTILFPSFAISATNLHDYNLHQGPYVEANVGTVFTIFSKHDDTYDFGFNAIIGMQVNDYLAFEIGDMFGMDISDDSDDFDRHEKMIHAAVKGIWPVGHRSSVFAKLGVAKVDIEEHLKLYGNDIEVSTNFSGPFLGVGMEWAFTNNFGMTLGFDGVFKSIKHKYDNVWHKENVLLGLFGLGLIYHFQA